MTMIISRPAKATWTLRAIAASALALAVAAGNVAGAAEPAGYGPGGAGQGVDGGSRRLDLSIGRSVILDLPRDAKEVFVGNPAIANAIVRSTRKIFLIGIANGSTSVFVMDGEGRQIATFEVNVGRDLSVLRQTLRTVIPNGRIDVRAAGDSILLTGVVQSAGEAQQAVDIAKAFVGQVVAGIAPTAGQNATTGPGGAAGGAGPAIAAAAASPSTVSGNVINALTISGRDQVMLRVSVVEVARSVVKQLGVNVSGNWNIIGDTAAAGALAAGAIVTTNQVSGLKDIVSGAIGSIGGSGANIGGQFTSNGAAIGGTLTALEQAGLSRVLAEPTLVAVSGENATFLVGGEIPISIGCGSAACVPTILFKQYGIQLTFTPVVLSEGRISMRVSTEVSEVDRETAARDGTPGFRTRKTATSIELPSGATMMTAGLISTTSAQTINGLPGLINLPILGTLFRSRNFQRRESELMVMVTPFIAKPMEAAQVKRPDDGFVDSGDSEAVLLGKLNKIYGVAGTGVPVKAGAGRFGFITD